MADDVYRIPIDGDWSLEDLYVFPRAYEQCYFAYLALAATPPSADDDRIARAYEAFPWQGGYSAVDFYNQLKWSVTKRKRPTIIRIRYGSPGVIELGGLLVSIAVIIERVVHTLCKAAREVNQTYSAIHRDLQKRRLLRIKTDNEIRKLTPLEQARISKHAEELATILDVDLAKLNERTSSPYISLKILLSLFRRMRAISEFQRRGKVRLEERRDS